MTAERIAKVAPRYATPGGRVVIEGDGLPVDSDVTVGGRAAHVVRATPRALTVLVPADLTAGPQEIKVAGTPGATPLVEVGAEFSTGLHQVDNPAFDARGNLYLTFSGSRGQQVPVSIFRVGKSGLREAFVTGLTNPTSMAFDSKGRLHVSSRFEGTVYRIADDGSYEPFATDLGVACGLAFDRDDRLYVGDRSGSIFRIAPTGVTEVITTLPASVAAFHLALSPDGTLFVSGPTLATRDGIYRIGLDGTVELTATQFGRPQGLAFDQQGNLYVVEALAGASGVYRVRRDDTAELTVSGVDLVGLAFDPTGGFVVCSNETAYRFASPLVA